MDRESEALKQIEELKKQGLTPPSLEAVMRELGASEAHDIPLTPQKNQRNNANDIYGQHDLVVLQDFPTGFNTYTTQLHSLSELLERDKQREEDGFPRKIRVGKLIKPGKGGKDKIVVVPSTVEEKFIHYWPTDEETGEGQASGGTGKGEEGEVIGEQPVQQQGEGSGTGAGQGEGETHDVESSAYDLGRILTEKFQLPNLRDKGKKRALSNYTYELTDLHQGFGQLLDKKATLRQVVETNINLGRIKNASDIDTTEFLVSPKDKIYRILSREKDYESQAIVFFMRDYSGSMSGKPTEVIVSQHVMIYSWLLFQFSRLVTSRFIVHDTEAKEVPDFFTYYNSKVAGGTKVASAFRLVNEIVEKEGLAKDYNIYVFHGTDGDDWDTNGKETLPEINKMLMYTNRLGITVARNSYSATKDTDMERYIKTSKILEKRPNDIRMDIMTEDATETRIIEGIKKLIS